MKLLPGGKKLEHYQHIYIYLHAYSTLSLYPFLVTKGNNHLFYFVKLKDS